MYEITQEDIQFGHRFMMLLTQLGISTKERLIVGAMLSDPRPWRIQTLSEYTGYTRTACRTALRNGVSAGFMEEVPGEGYRITERGVQRCWQILGEVCQIARRERRCFSEGLLEAFEEDNSREPDRPWVIGDPVL